MPWNGFGEIVALQSSEYKLTYYVDGEVYKTDNLKEGDAITPEPAPTKEGYSFSGWSDIPETMPDHDVDVTGTFAINTYKLTYMVDGEVYKTYDIEYGAKITPEAEPTREGYTFSGWSEIPETMPANDVIVTGTFAINKYNISYKVDGEVYKSYDLEYGSEITPETEPSKEGYTFSGWDDIPATMPAKDIIVSGSFTINQYTITYIIDGEVYQTETIDYNSTITPPTVPERDGYDFAWEEYPESMPAHDITIYGSFTLGIGGVSVSDVDVKIFAINGQRQNKMQKGVNIIRMKDGKTKKVMVK